jgi:formate-dependent nitrite reductase membrane component NrfD
MQTRQWMITHEWMVKPMQQKEWIERRGMLVWIAEVFTSLGAGLYLVSLFMNNWWGMAASWLIIMFLKVPIHILYFGQPLRFFRTLPPFSDAWKRSWFARGILFTVLFSTFSFIQLAIRNPYFDFAPYLGTAEAPLYWVFTALAAIFALGTGIYSGFIMNKCKTIPFWNTGILPIVFLLAGMADGFGLIIGIGLAGGDVNIAFAETCSRITLFVNAFIIGIYLISVNFASEVASLSVRQLLVGRFAAVFWLGVIVLGIMAPLAISVSSFFTGVEATSVMLITAIICHTIGAFALKYCLLKAGIHQPILLKLRII